MTLRGTLPLVIISALLAGCATPIPRPDFSRFEQENPRSILVVPVVNNSPEVGAEDFFLATITLPIGERGYYIFPVNLAKELLADSGLSDPGLVHSADTQRIAKLFGADAVLYVVITNWEAKYLVLSTTVTVGFEYVLKSGRTGEVLWSTAQTMVYSPQGGGSGNLIADIVVMAVQAAVTKAMPNYVPLARQANWTALAGAAPGQGRAGKRGFPILYGPYHANYLTDREPK